MIFVKRSQKPKILVKNEVIWTKKIKESKEKYDANKTESNKNDLDKAIKKYNHPEIKSSLESMLHGKCAFCESFIQNVDYGDIEHFKPKSKFPELAVSWDNLLLACKKCNGKEQKGDEWPTLQNGGPLINPSEENPEDFFEFEFDEETMVSIVKPLNPRGITSERIYGLNKHELLKDRNKYVKMLVFIARRYNQDNEAKLIIDEAVKDQGEYAAFARMVKAKFTLK